MIVGIVRGREPLIRLMIRGFRGRQREIEALVDTGYTGWLTLPPTVIGWSIQRACTPGECQFSQVCRRAGTTAFLGILVLQPAQRYPAEALRLRSMFVHLWDTTEAESAATLDALCPGQRHPWFVRYNGDTYLFVDFYQDGPAEDEDWAARFKSQDGLPSVTIMVAISGRHDGWPETQAFVAELLGRFRGVATDDGWARLWLRDEIAEDHVIDGQRFGEWRNHRVEELP
jgi:hypothetical protein